jgi:proteasome lid subunit RPN8/RPN11
MSDLPIIEGRLKLSLLGIIRSRLPHEAVGIIYNDMAYELRNDHDFPNENFAVDKRELRALIETLMVPMDQIADEVFLWHSHPGGGIGPSRFDMTHKTPLKNHLVVTIVDGDLVPTWY